MRNDRKVAKHLFRPAFFSVSVVVFIIYFFMIESVESTNRASSETRNTNMCLPFIKEAVTSRILT
jgi:hypothetical protein